MAQYTLGRLVSSGKIVSIEDIPMEKHLRNEWACECPGCGAKLTPKKGLLREHHFAHAPLTGIDAREASIENCTPETANETALHIMAKEIVSEERRIVAPDRVIRPEDVAIFDLPYDVVRDVPPYKASIAKKVTSDSVEVEKTYGKLRPDATLHTMEGLLFVEFCVSHRKSATDKRKAQEYGLPVLEIVLEQFLYMPFSKKELTSFLCDSSSNRSWIYFPISEAEETAARQYYESNELVRRYRFEQECKEKGAEKFSAFLENEEIYSNEVARLRDDNLYLTKMRAEEQTNDFYYPFAAYFRDHGETPFFVDIPVTGETVFQCDRRIWQSIVFNRYVFCRSKENARFNENSIFRDLKDDHAVPIDWTLAYPLQKHPYHAPRHLPSEAIKTYISVLKHLGFIEGGRDEWCTVLNRGTITPPNSEASAFLKDLLLELNQNNPLISDNIICELESYHERIAAQRKREEEQQRIIATQRRKECESLRMEEELKIHKKREEAEIQNLANYDNPNRFFTVGGQRWVHCILCDQKVKEQDTAMTGINGNPNKGWCRACSRKMR